jgi:hypothetical protein
VYEGIRTPTGLRAEFADRHNSHLLQGAVQVRLLPRAKSKVKSATAADRLTCARIDSRARTYLEESMLLRVEKQVENSTAFGKQTAVKPLYG